MALGLNAGHLLLINLARSEKTN